MVADKMTLITKSPKSDMGVKWTSTGDGSYEIEEFEKKRERNFYYSYYKRWRGVYDFLRRLEDKRFS